MFIDTHCHLNFKAVSEDNTLDGEQVAVIIKRAKENKVEKLVIPGTTIESSKIAVKIANQYDGVYASVGIHPHHALSQGATLKELVLENLLQGDTLKGKIVAVGEVGIDKHSYQITQYENYRVDSFFLAKQIELFKNQITLAKTFKKSLIIHNREATSEMLKTLEQNWSGELLGRTVFHCCEADERLLEFTRKHQIFIGIDGDISWSKKKQRFIYSVPIENLVLETDSPFLLPESLKKIEKYNEPKNIPLIAGIVAQIKGISLREVEERTTENAEKLFKF